MSHQDNLLVKFTTRTRGTANGTRNRTTGLQRGRQEELRLIVGGLLTAHFGNLDEQLLAVVAPIMKLSLTERTDLFLNLSQLSREELLAKFLMN